VVAEGTQGYKGLFIPGGHAPMVDLLKDRNLGKLQSHDLFFATICRQLQPTYCFQIDCGTALEPDVLGKLAARMERSPDVAALALRILPAAPQPDDGLVVSWQYVDFALQKSIGWPFEMACGYLSVVPGQASVYRWNALESGGSLGQGLSDDAPLQAYLRGAETSNPLARLMFLAEDRVIGSHLVMGGGRRWQLGYAPEAGATTDSCPTLAELLRQRRRWRNSALACLVSLFGQWRRYLARQGWNGRRGWMFSAALAGQLLLALKGFFAPAQLLGLVAVLVSMLSAVRIAPAFGLIRGIFVAALVGQLILLPVGRTAWRLTNLPGRVRRAAQLLTSGLLLGGLLLLLPINAVALLLLAPAAALISLRLTLPAGGIAAIADIPLLPFVYLGMESVLSAYSWWNFNDVSWGTKGIRRTHTDSQVARRLQHWRNRWFSGWVMTNSVLAITAFCVRGAVSSALNPVTEVLCLADGMIAMLGLLCVLGRRWWRRYE